MVTLNRIYTRTGDEGFTGLVGGSRISKTAPRVWAYGDIDELNAHLGMCRTLASKNSRCSVIPHLIRRLFRSQTRPPHGDGCPAISSKLERIQNELFDLGSELATPPGSSWEGMPRTSEEQIDRLEAWIDELNSHLSDLKSFVLPGGAELNSVLHIARTVCRRAERTVLALKHQEEVSDLIVRYLNRLSDLLFVMSRYASFQSGTKEYLWVPGGQRAKEA